MTSDIVALIDYYERERMLPREQVQEALEHAFVTAFQKMVPGSEAIERIRAHIEKRGDVKIFAELLVVEPENLRDSFNQVPLAAAVTKAPNAQLGDWVEFEVTPKNFNRKGIDTAKQTIMQRLRYASKVSSTKNLKIAQEIFLVVKYHVLIKEIYLSRLVSMKLVYQLVKKSLPKITL